jgi:hypothetical protein
MIVNWFAVWLFWWLSFNSMARVLRRGSYVRVKEFARRSTYVPLRPILGDVLREVMQRLSVALHGTLSSIPIFVALCWGTVLIL